MKQNDNNSIDKKSRITSLINVLRRLKEMYYKTDDLIKYPFTIPIVRLILGIILFIIFIMFLLFLVICFALDWNLNLTPEVSVYIVLTSISIIITTFGNRIFKNWNKTKSKPSTNQGFGQRVVRFTTFLIYFILLIAFNFTSLNNGFIMNERIKDAILQSFATYIAYDRIYANKDIIFNKRI